MEYVTLGNYCSITSSKRIFAEQYVEKGVPFYRSKEIIEKNNGQDISEPLYIEPEVYETIKKKFGVPQKGDLLLTSVGTIGIPYIVKDEQFYFKDGNLTWMRNFSKELSSKYLYYWISSKFGKDSLVNRCIGSSQAALTIDILKNYKLLIPKRDIQDKVVSILSAYDNLIENNSKRIKILEQMAENLYKEWFVRFRFPGHETTPLENGIPKGWKKGELADVCCFLRGKNITSSEMIDGPYPVIAAGLDPSGYHSVANVKGTSVTISNSGANAGYISIHYSDIWAADCSYVSENDTKNIFFVYEMLRNLSSVITNMQRGAAQPHVYAKDVNQLKMYLPDEKLMSKANIQFKAFHQQIFVLTKQNEFLIKQRDLLLPRLMSGKLAV